ncbi:IclR family transcriptional regulator C-terminal domain-containing protein [Streptomyces sp. 150FB]|uniref:IclR family transcriptional regulator n=1 Tax=Streptomyces sp. 150FB TaxID=1576605 RepID=UPI00099CF371|nr:IclR family transcriptional regulator C-terminal domain-containing protein [Streptomyces sp. 150FB]
MAGPRILTLAGKVTGRLNPAQHADTALCELSGDTGCTVHFALLDADRAVYAAKLESAKPYHMPSRVGLSIGLHCSGIGKAILAALPPAEADALLERTGLQVRTPRTIDDPAELRGQLAVIRARGWAYDNEENEPGILCVAAAARTSGRGAGDDSGSGSGRLRRTPTSVRRSSGRGRSTSAGRAAGRREIRTRLAPAPAPGNAGTA